MSLTGKTALVTGAGSGIGEAIARTFASDGAAVVVADIRSEATEAVAESLRASGAISQAITADCGSVAEVQAMVDEAADLHGRLDILVNNAGFTYLVDLLEMDEAGWDKVNRVNIKGAFFALQRAAARMVEGGEGGRIVNIASISGRGYAAAANPAYVASKGGLIALTHFAAHRLGRHGINVNAICPGLTVTDLLGQVMADKAQALGTTRETLIAEAARAIPIGRANTPEDVAALALFLVGESGRNITGQAYNIDGGLVNN